MWEDLQRIDWGRLTHAYGPAHDVPEMLRRMVSADAAERGAGWSQFWGSVNHQGDFYDSTVAAVPFLVEAAAGPEVPGRASILDYFRSRLHDAPDYGGDPRIPEPPGGVDEPTPLLDDAVAAAPSGGPAPADDEEAEAEFDTSRYRAMDLAAWQTGRGIQAGRPVFRRLLSDPDRAVAAAAAELLLTWPEERAVAKAVLVSAIDEEREPVEQARRVLELGVYADPSDAGALARWADANSPPELRTAAALVWARLCDPAPLPPTAAEALREASDPGSPAFARLPWEGVYHRGPWDLPRNAADLILRLADNADDEMRWRAVQGLEAGRETVRHLPLPRIVPALIRRLADRDPRVRQTAAGALAQRGLVAHATDPAVVPALITNLTDADASACGGAARALAAMSSRLSAVERAWAVAGVEVAARRLAGQTGTHVHMGSRGVVVPHVLGSALKALLSAEPPGVRDLLAALFEAQTGGEGPAPAEECERLLADTYDADPDRLLATAIDALAGTDRPTCLGAAAWLAKLGPAAAGALAALDRVAGGERDEYAKSQARGAAASIRDALAVASRDVGAGLLPQPATVDRLAFMLGVADVRVRAAAARRLAELAPTTPAVAGAAGPLVSLLADDSEVIVGVAARVVADGHVYYWRTERQSPRAWAARALLRAGVPGLGPRVLEAMLEEAIRPSVQYAGDPPLPERFTPEEWKAALSAAGDPAEAEAAVRRVRQRCLRSRPGSRSGAGSSRETVPGAEAGLAQVLRRLSGRLV